MSHQAQNLRDLTAKEIDRLTKVMALTTSDKDGEALSAVRIANGILDRAGYRWENVFSLVQRLTTSGRTQQNGGAKGYSSSYTAAEAAWHAYQQQSAQAESNRQRREEEKTSRDYKLIARAFNIIYSTNLSGGFREFIDSLQSQWETMGSLSPKQKTSLFKCAARHAGENWHVGI